MRVVLRAGLVVIGLTFAATNANAWFCTAESKNGSTGTGFSIFQSESEKAALKECRLHSKGQRCKITSCW